MGNMSLVLALTSLATAWREGEGAGVNALDSRVLQKKMMLYKERSRHGRTVLRGQQQPGAALPSTAFTSRPLLLNSTKNCSSAGISNGNGSEILLFRHGNPDMDIPEDSESLHVLGASPTRLCGAGNTRFSTVLPAPEHNVPAVVGGSSHPASSRTSTEVEFTRHPFRLLQCPLSCR